MQQSKPTITITFDKFKYQSFDRSHPNKKRLPMKQNKTRKKRYKIVVTKNQQRNI